LFLQHVAQEENIPVENLEILSGHISQYPLLGIEVWNVTIFDATTGQPYPVLYNLDQQTFSDDPYEYEFAVRETYTALFGKLDEALFYRLQIAGDGEIIPVMIWVIAPPKPPDAEIFALLAAKYPEAQESMELYGVPFHVDDSDLMQEIENEYTRLATAHVDAAVAPLLAELESRGYEVTSIPGMPLLGASLPKEMILEMGDREDVGKISLDEEATLPEATPAPGAS
jgi:hypothetical protein